MIKCPNCGSTAQVRLIKEYWSKMSQSSNKHYNCGCGCVFYIEKMSNGIINGGWQVLPKEGAD
jgi:hypothetical protein